jgi:hypothetical protein
MMRRLRTFLIFLLVSGVAALLALAQQTPAMRILSPQNGEKITVSYVTVSYELQAPADASGTPTFQVQLDRRDPVRTTDTQYTFTGIAPGPHVVVVEAVDANNTPITGTRAEAKFSVVPSPATGTTGPGAASHVLPSGNLVNASMQSQPSNRVPSQKQLPESGSSLPLLSVIGMGVLVGGIASALRTRHSSSRSH